MTKKEPLSRVRARALNHMRGLLATSAAAIAASDAACHPNDKKAGDAGTDATAFGPPADTADAAPWNNPTLPAVYDAGPRVDVDRNHGYAVVDPMPMPAHCSDVVNSMRGKAVKSGENVVLSVTNAGGKNGFKYGTSTPTVINGKLVSYSVNGQGSAVVTYKPGAGTVDITVRGACGRAGLVSITASVMPDLSVQLNQF